MMNAARFTSRPMAAMAFSLLLILLSSCGSDLYEERAAPVDQNQLAQNLAPSSTDNTETTSVSVPADEPFAEAFTFTAASLSGDTIDGAQLFEDKPAIFAFVTPWCPICLTEAPALVESARNNPDVDFVLVHTAGTSAEFEAFRDDTDLIGDNVIHIEDVDAELWQRFEVTSQPTYLLLDREWVARQSVGALESHGLDRAIELVRNEG